MRRLKVGDRVQMTKKGVELSRTRFMTGVVKEVSGVDGFLIRVKRDEYRGHESQWWTSDYWKKY